MTNYEKLLVEIEGMGIKVKEVDFNTNKECGYYCNNKILINSRLTCKQKYGVLAEELGHYHKTVGIIINQKNINNRKQELIARRWSYDKAVGLLGLIKAFEYGCKDRYEIAEYLDVTVDYLNEVLEYYASKYGVIHRIDNYIIYFSPTVCIGKAF